jgi:hypothetical protein
MTDDTQEVEVTLWNGDIVRGTPRDPNDSITIDVDNTDDHRYTVKVIVNPTDKTLEVVLRCPGGIMMSGSEKFQLRMKELEKDKTFIPIDITHSLWYLLKDEVLKTLERKHD